MGLRKLVQGQTAQVAIEGTLAIVFIFILLFGIMQMFVWMNHTIIERQKAYQRSRVSLGSVEAINFYSAANYPNKTLYVFPEEKP